MIYSVFRWQGKRRADDDSPAGRSSNLAPALYTGHAEPAAGACVRPYMRQMFAIFGELAVRRLRARLGSRVRLDRIKREYI